MNIFYALAMLTSSTGYTVGVGVMERFEHVSLRLVKSNVGVPRPCCTEGARYDARQTDTYRHTHTRSDTIRTLYDDVFILLSYLMN